MSFEDVGDRAASDLVPQMGQGSLKPPIAPVP
jgi:hypothetical protein